MKLFATIVILLASLTSVCAGAVDHEAIDEWPIGSAMHTANLHKQARDRIERRLQSQHARVVSLVRGGAKFSDEALLQAMDAQHAAWLKYRDAECGLVGALTGAGGSWPSAYALECEANLTNRRFRTLRAAATCVEKELHTATPDERRCLYRLTPLATTK